MHTTCVRSFSLCLLVFLVAASAVSAGPLTGRVLDPSGRSVPDAGVLLVGGSTIVDRARTDRDGTFRIVTPDGGRYELRVAADGFAARAVAVDAQPAERDLGTVTLQVSAFTESVVVSASQVEAPLSQASSTVTVITRAELAARQIESVADALRAVPGLTVVGTGGRGSVTSVFPRGGESDYALVFVDGVQANAFGGGFDFAHLPVSNVERIEVVRGPQSALFGSNAIGAVVRIVTRQDGRGGVDGAVEAGGYATTRVSGGGSASRGPWQVSVSAERTASDGLNGQRLASGETVANDDYERRNAVLTAGWRGPGGARLQAQLDYGHDERGFPGPFGTNPVGAFAGIDTVSRGTNERWLSSIAATVPTGDRVHTRVQVTNGRIDGAVLMPSFEDPHAVATSHSSSRRTTARVQSDFEISTALGASAGFELQRERADSTFITDGVREVPVTRQVLGYFGEVRWTAASRVYVTGGVRADDIRRDALAANETGFVPRPAFGAESIVSVNPRLSAAWFVRQPAGDFTKVRAAVGTGIRPPEAFEIAFTDNPSLKPERSRSYEAGLDQALAGGRVLVEATAFDNRFDDLIIAVGSFLESSRYTTDNISNARARGLELAGTAHPWGADGPVDVQIRVTYTRLDTHVLAVDRSRVAPSPFAVGDPLLRRPRHQMSADVVATAGRLTAYLRGGARSRVLDVEPSLGTFGGLFAAPGFNVWNTGAAWNVARSIDIVARVDNVFDRAYEEALGYPALGRAAMIGMRVAARR